MFPEPLSLLPKWVAEPPPLHDDELMPGFSWGYHVLQMANRAYHPAHMAYRRGIYGEDHRLKYLLYFLDVRDQRVLELGPYEGHHSLLLEKLGVRETVSLEARPDNYHKCLHVKDKYQLARTTFHLADIEALYTGAQAPPYAGRFDLVFCLGLLYHVPDPIAALQWCHKQGRQLFLGTHYVETQIISQYKAGFQPGDYQHLQKTYDGLWYTEHGITDALSGMSPRSFWPTEVALIQMLHDAGYNEIHVLGKDIQNRHPHITLLAGAQ